MGLILISRQCQSMEHQAEAIYGLSSEKGALLFEFWADTECSIDKACPAADPGTISNRSHCSLSVLLHSLYIALGLTHSLKFKVLITVY